jgi:hypothetical protein
MIDEDLKQLIEGTAAETRKEFAAVADDLRHRFDIATEALRSQGQLVAESVLTLSERMDRRFADLDSRMADEFAETRAMIRLGDADLDRRLRALEERVERLESNTAH